MPEHEFPFVRRVSLVNFTAFRRLDLDPSPGVNVLIGANGTGKTHILKVIHATAHTEETSWKLLRLFRPYGRDHERLTYRRSSGEPVSVEVSFRWLEVRVSFEGSSQPRHLTDHLRVVEGAPARPFPRTVFVPAGEILSNAPGFRSLYNAREVSYDETYVDLIDDAYLPELRALDSELRQVLGELERHIGGQVSTRNEHFFLGTSFGELEFSLVAEGLRKLALLWLLIRNGSIAKGTILLWDEPEANLNPENMKSLVSMLLVLRRIGVQIFLATHDYALLKEFDLQAKPEDEVVYHVLYRKSDDGPVEVNTVENYSQIRPSKINEAFDDMLDRDFARKLKPRKAG